MLQYKHHVQKQSNFFGNNDTNNNNSSTTNTTTNSNGIVGMDAIIVQRVMRDSERQHVEDTLLEQVQKHLKNFSN